MWTLTTDYISAVCRRGWIRLPPSGALVINVLKLCTISRARQHVLQARTIQVLTDMTTAVFYVKKPGAVSSDCFCQEVVEFLHMELVNSQDTILGRSPELPSRLPELVIQHASQMVSQHSYSKISVSSRRSSDSGFICNLPEQEMSLMLFKSGSQSQGHLGCFPVPVGQRPAECIRTRATHSQGHCLKQEWNGIILVAPLWPWQPWYSGLCRLSTREPLLLSVIKGLISQNHRQVLHCNSQMLHLTELFFSGLARWGTLF